MKFVLTILALLAPLSAQAATRAVFVGVNTYLYSKTAERAFENLDGAVDDVARIKDALRAAYSFDLDRPKAGQCNSSNAVSITLTERCATYDAVRAALDRQIAASAKGDTVLFYFAGHGAQTDDGTFHDQITARNDTILPVDAREPDGDAKDILDRDLRRTINGAVERGINVVTIFDSCHSGTATRGFTALGKRRTAPALKIGPAPDIGVSNGPGYWVHMGGSTDDEESYEMDVGGGKRGGVFTDALVKTLAQPRIAASTFGDIMRAVQLAMRDAGRVNQHPQIEGRLNASFAGGRGLDAALVEATAKGASATLSAGRLAGVTAGSTFGLFNSRAAALDPKAKPLVVARVATIDTRSAALTLDVPLTGAMVAREIDHAYGDRQLRVGLVDATPDVRAAVVRALKDAPFAVLADPPQVVVGRNDKNEVPFGLYTVDGDSIVSLPQASAPDFGARLVTALKQLAQVQAMLALRTDPTRGDVGFCIGQDGGNGCKPTTDPRGPRLISGLPVAVEVVNNTDRPRHFYVYGIDGANNVAQILPIVGTIDDPLPKHSTLPQTQRIVPRTPGKYLFMVIATDTPIEGSALQQSGTRSVTACGSALARLLCDATSGTRDITAPSVGDWSALVLPATVVPGATP